MRIVEAFDRLGTESAFSVLAKAQALRQQGRDIINLGIGQPDFPTPPHIVEAAIKALRDGHHGYTPANGILPLREAVAADIHHYRQIEVNPDHIVIVPGGKPTMAFAMMLFGEPGGEIIYPDPGFPIYRSMIQFTGATAIPYTLEARHDFAMKADDILAKITDQTRLIIVNSPGNPTGGVTPKSEFDRLVKGLENWPDVAILSDEIYSRLLFDGAEHTSLLSYPSIRDRVILLDGWSKTYAMTGWRMGYAVWPSNLVDAVTRLCVNIHSCVNAPTQMAGIAALQGPQDAVDEMVRAFDERRLVMAEKLSALPGISCPVPGGAFYAFPDISGTGLGGKDMQDRLLEEAGIATVAGTSFGDFATGNIRLSCANSLENIEAAIARIGEWLSKVSLQ